MQMRVNNKYANALRRNRRTKPSHDIFDCQKLRAAWHEAGHAVIALMNCRDISRGYVIKEIQINKYKSDSRELNSKGYIMLNSIATGYACLHDYMPPEYYVAGVVSDAILTGSYVNDSWDIYPERIMNKLTDKGKLHELFPDLTFQDECELLERTEVILREHLNIIRKITKRLLHYGNLYYDANVNYLVNDCKRMANDNLVNAIEASDIIHKRIMDGLKEAS